jgi:DNA-directed RNA polymerase specialized sigma24 family protein
MNAAKRVVVEAERHPNGEPWSALSARLVRTARHKGLSREDAEDCAQEALFRVVREVPRPDAPGLGVRAGAALRLAMTDEFRRTSRQKAIPASKRIDIDAGEAREIPDHADPDRRMRLMEVVDAVRESAGEDAIRLVLEGEAGYTEAESGRRGPTGAPSIGATRKRLSRALPEIAKRITDLEGDR